MIKISDFSIRENNIYITFLSNELTVSTVVSATEIIDKNNIEIIDYMYKKIKPFISDWYAKNNEIEDLSIDYIDLDLSLLNTQNPKIITQEEIQRINDENIRVMNLISTQRTQSGLLQSQDEIKNLKSLVADLTSLLLGV